MNIQEFIEKLTEEQKAQLDELSTAEEILSYAKELGFDLDVEALQSALQELSEQDLDEVAGGISQYTYHPSNWPKKKIFI